MSVADDPDSAEVNSSARRARLGVFGGTFDPPHHGHVAIAVAAIDALELDELLVVVANDPYQKSERPTATAVDRLRLAEVAFGGIDRVVVDDRELRRGGPSFTIDTVESIGLRPGAVDEVFVIVGADAARSLATWHRADDLARVATIAVVGRAGVDDIHVAGFRFVKISMAGVDVSSSEVRRRLAQGLSLDGLVPSEVIREIQRLRLYTGSQ